MYWLHHSHRGSVPLCRTHSQMAHKSGLRNLQRARYYILSHTQSTRSRCNLKVMKAKQLMMKYILQTAYLNCVCSTTVDAVSSEIWVIILLMCDNMLINLVSKVCQSATLQIPGTSPVNQTRMASLVVVQTYLCPYWVWCYWYYYLSCPAALQWQKQYMYQYCANTSVSHTCIMFSKNCHSTTKNQVAQLWLLN